MSKIWIKKIESYLDYKILFFIIKYRILKIGEMIYGDRKDRWFNS